MPTYLQPTQRRLVDLFLRQAVASTATDRSLSDTLFELLTPTELKQYAPDQRKLALVVDSVRRSIRGNCCTTGSTAVAADGRRDGDGPPAVDRPCVPTAGRRGEPRARGRRSDRRGWSGQFDPLPGAAREARDVTAILRAKGYDVTDLVEAAADPRAVVSALFAILIVMHVAGHGVFEFAVSDDVAPVAAGGGPPKTGCERRERRCRHRRHEAAPGNRVVLGNGLFLTPAEFGQLRTVPGWCSSTAVTS